MFARVVLIAALSAVTAAAGLLGVDYSEWFPPANQMATDASGNLYVLAWCPVSGSGVSCVTKVSPDGTTALWQDNLGFEAVTMAVSPSGSVFVVPYSPFSDASISVAKLDAGGSGIAWNLAVGLAPTQQELNPVLATDSQGRTYVATTSGVARVKSDGSGVDFRTPVSGYPTAIAADGSGAVMLAGYIRGATGFVTRVAGDGSVVFTTTLSQAGIPALALDGGGNAVVLGSGLLWRLDSAGHITVSTPVLGSALALDSVGNAYVLGVVEQLYPVQNSIAQCQPITRPYPVGAVGSAPILTVVATDGSVPQITYVPGSAYSSTLLLASGPNSTVFVASSSVAGFAPSQTGPFPQTLNQPALLLRMSPHSGAAAAPFACIGNALTYLPHPVASGEMVALIGNGLGPAQGVQTQASAQSPFPTLVSGVRVTFGGTPAPLMWVQDSQINAIVPWSLKPGSNTQICVTSDQLASSCLSWPVAQADPGILTYDGNFAVALNQDGSVNSAANPATPGSIVSVFATGPGGGRVCGVACGCAAVGFSC